jgi:uncharacterized protein YndB with AHSA1/START domain
MDASAKDEPGRAQGRTAVERRSERELVIARIVNRPVHLVFEAFTKPELLQRWWAPKSSGLSLVSCEVDARAGGGYRFVFGRDGAQTMAFFGRYLEVTPPSRLVWTNEEGEDGGAVTTVTFEASGARTLLRMHDVYPTKEALDAMLAGMEEGMRETLEQLDELLASLAAQAGQVRP